MVGTVREVLGKSLKVLEEEGLVKITKDRHIVISNRNRLAMIASST
jgi:hypothetical protein